MRLKNGWIGVVNRGQADIVSGASMQAARARELEFFKSKPCYASLKNVGTSFLSARLSEHLVGAIKRALPTISAGISDGIAGLEKELELLGGPSVDGRGGMVHLLLQLTRQFEEAFAQAVDGGKNGGEQILTVFEKRLSDNIGRLGFAKILEPANVRRVVEEADGYQPHLIAPEMGYRRLLQECLALFAKPADTAVDETHAILRQIVAATLDSPQCAALGQYAHLRHAIARTAAASLDGFKADARAMVNTLVEMERSYLTAEVFKEILHQSGRSAESGELIRTLSGRGVGDAVGGDDGMLPSSLLFCLPGRQAPAPDRGPRLGLHHPRAHPAQADDPEGHRAHTGDESQEAAARRTAARGRRGRRRRAEADAERGRRDGAEEGAVRAPAEAAAAGGGRGGGVQLLKKRVGGEGREVEVEVVEVEKKERERDLKERAGI